MAEKTIDYKDSVTKQKQLSLELLPIGCLMFGILAAVFIGGFFGFGVYGYMNAQPYIHATGDGTGFGFTEGERFAYVLFQSTACAALIGGVLGIGACMAADAVKTGYKKEMEQKYKIKLVD